jgi:tRNA 2-selenouridine synthase
VVKRIIARELFGNTFRWIIDVRSPGEFEAGHIPNSISLPLFSNDERAAVGTLYKKEGQAAAIELGLEIVGPKLADFLRTAKELSQEKPLTVLCWRGGKRSASMAWLFQTGGLDVQVVEGGYNAFRQAGMELMKEIQDLRLLVGNTGSGKTQILQEMERLGSQVIDLEGLANHRGSAFGHLGMQPQPTTEQFQNDVFWKVGTLNLALPIWVEGESITIGKCVIPNPFWEKMLMSPYWVVERSREERVQQILKDYGDSPTEDLLDSLQRVSRKMGPQHAKTAAEHIQTGHLEAAVHLFLDYYDRFYEGGFARRLGENRGNIRGVGEKYFFIAKKLLEGS